MAQTKEGLFCRKDRKFYYLETGHATAYNSIDRLRGILIRRGLISYHKKSRNDTSVPYKIMTLEEAQEKGLEVEILYLNKHIEKTIKAKEKKKTKTSPWGR